MCIIDYIEPDSIADDLGLKSGDEILSINGYEIHDIIDYRFYTDEEYIELSVIKEGLPEIIEIEKDYEEDLGIGFNEVLFDNLKVCGANCMFCFERQLPKGMRKSLTLRDDDYRLSFLYGNFITLANLKERDINRIIEQRLSPLYVSVHTTDEALREKIIGRKFPPFMETIKKLTKNGISLHCQVVSCPGVNDGEKLQETIDTLSNIENILSLAVVPVGLTGHRENLPLINPYTKEGAKKVLNIIKKNQAKFKQEKGTNFVWASDEFFIKAEEEIPNEEYYEDYSQLENGIGLVRDFLTDAKTCIDKINKISEKITFITGVSFYPFLKKLFKNNENLNVLYVKNDFFGHSVTVTGLLTAKDIINQLKGKDLGKYLFIPNICINDNLVFLDDLTIEDIEKELHIKVILSEVYLSDTLDKLNKKSEI